MAVGKPDVGLSLWGFEFSLSCRLTDAIMDTATSP